MAKYGDRFAFGGCYFVNEKSRGREHGKKIYDTAMVSAKHFPTIGAFSDLPEEEMHIRNGFRGQFYGAFFVFNIPATMACFSETSKTSPVKIKSIEEVNMQALFMYDTTVFGFERQNSNHPGKAGTSDGRTRKKEPMSPTPGQHFHSNAFQ